MKILMFLVNFMVFFGVLYVASQPSVNTSDKVNMAIFLLSPLVMIYLATWSLGKRQNR